jgi:asparagine synthase (glutamine-hydrolysing)
MIDGDAHSVIVSLTDPDVRDVAMGPRRWFVSGLAAARYPIEGAAADVDVAAAVTRFLRSYPDTSVVAIDTSASGKVVLGRGLHAGHECIYTTSGPLVVSDHLRNVLAELPRDQRRLDEDALVLHFAFGTVFGRSTLCRGVRKLAPGDIQVLHGDDRLEAPRVIDRIEAEPDLIDRTRAVAELEEAIDDAVRSSLKPGTALLFSGGVDSTLLMSFALGSATPLTLVPSTPEFAGETKYARAAARHLGVIPRELNVPEDAYPEALAEATRNAGVPLRYLAGPVFEAAYDEHFNHFIEGEGADGAFGGSMAQTRVAIMLRHAPTRMALKLAAGAAPQPYRAKAMRLHDVAYRVTVPAPSINSLAIGISGPRIAAALEETAVTRAQADAAVSATLDHVLQRIRLDSAPDDVVRRNIELRHWTFSLTDDTSSSRYPAQARGKSIATPFTSARVLRTLARVPSDRRFARGFKGKWLLKAVLESRVPSYPVHQKKRHTALPFDRFTTSGPLADIWERYDVPDVFTAEGKRRARAFHSELTWQAINLAVWLAEVFDRDLPPLPATAWATFSTTSTTR